MHSFGKSTPDLGALRRFHDPFKRIPFTDAQMIVDDAAGAAPAVDQSKPTGRCPRRHASAPARAPARDRTRKQAGFKRAKGMLGRHTRVNGAERPVRLRIPGKSQMVLLNSSTFVIVTSNGLSVSEDPARRFIIIELDSRTDGPKTRPKRDGERQFAT